MLLASTCSNWILVVLTAIYVVATIMICRANCRSASVAKDQIKEMKSQFLAMSRARLVIRFDKQNMRDMSIVIKNVGHQDAINVCLSVNDEFSNDLKRIFPNNLLDVAVKSVFHIATGQEFRIVVGFNNVLGAMKEKRAKFVLRYKDCYGNYTESTEIDFSQYAFISFYNDNGALFCEKGIF